MKKVTRQDESPISANYKELLEFEITMYRKGHKSFMLPSSIGAQPHQFACPTAYRNNAVSVAQATLGNIYGIVSWDVAGTSVV